MDEEIQVPEINVRQLKEQLAGPNPPRLIDVREQMEVSRGMIAGAAHIPMNSIPNRLADIPQDKPVVIYCATGARSYAVAAYLMDNGYSNVANLAGGIVAWSMLQAGR
jgi:rhodanese-related sulfurtransferase